MRVNGLMIDCSRLVERHEYYFQLIDFMTDWGMNLLLFHFTDDHGCAVNLPGFAPLAGPHAFSAAEVRSLIAYAAERGIDVVPEIETFGHTRYITDHPKYRHLYAGKRSAKISFNAIDPLHPESKRLMRRLLKATASLFPSPYLHIGCDEVNLLDYAAARGMDARQLWIGYVNAMIDEAAQLGKTPLFWADHTVRDMSLFDALDRRAVPVYWGYHEQMKEAPLRHLRQAGFAGTFAAPSTASYSYRFVPPAMAFKNMDLMVRHAVRQKSLGVINTVWCPYRYIQGAIYYGIAYGAAQARENGRLARTAFQREFAGKVFGTPLRKPLKLFLDEYIKLLVGPQHAPHLGKNPEEMPGWAAESLRTTNAAWHTLLPAATAYVPEDRRDIWAAMRLGADCAGLCSEWYVLASSRAKHAKRKADYNTRLRSIRRALGKDWDATRYADDPHKRRPRFPNERDQYALLVMKQLPYFT